MLRKSGKHFIKKQDQDARGFIGDIPAGQTRQVINPFVGRSKTASSLRSLDDFQRGEGYQSFTPRVVGMPTSEYGLTHDNNTLINQMQAPLIPEYKTSSRRSHRIFKILKKLF